MYKLVNLLVVSTTTWGVGDLAVGRSHLWRSSRSVSLLVHHGGTINDISAGHCRTGTDSVKPELGVDTNVVVGKLAKVGIIDTDNLGLFASSKSESRNKVHDPTDEGGDGKRPSGGSDNLGELVTELNVVVVWPSTIDLGTVESGDGSLSQESSHDGTDHTTYTVRGKDIESLVDTKQELELGSEITSGTGDESDSDSGGSSDETGSRGNTDETSDSSRAESDNGPLSLESVIPQHPSDTSYRSREIGNDTSHGSSEVGAESRTTVETEPTKPKEDCAEDDIGGVVGLVGESFSSVSPSLAEVECDSEGSGTGRNVNGGTTGKVESSETTSPSIGTPSPGGDGAVDDSQPDKDKDHDGSDSRSFGETTDSEDDSDELGVSERQGGRLSNLQQTFPGMQQRRWLVVEMSHWQVLRRHPSDKSV